MSWTVNVIRWYNRNLPKVKRWRWLELIGIFVGVTSLYQACEASKNTDSIRRLDTLIIKNSEMAKDLAVQTQEVLIRQKLETRAWKNRFQFAMSQCSQLVIPKNGKDYSNAEKMIVAERIAQITASQFDNFYLLGNDSLYTRWRFLNQIANGTAETFKYSNANFYGSDSNGRPVSGSKYGLQVKFNRYEELIDSTLNLHSWYDRAFRSIE